MKCGLIADHFSSLGRMRTKSAIAAFYGPTVNAGHANSVVAEMVYLCTNSVVDPICRDLRAFGGTSLDHKFLVGGPKSIYRAGRSATSQSVAPTD